jgi:AmmeMemoRadiSam system protein B
MKVRKASFAGSWYPATPSECENEIRNFLKDPGIDEIPDADYTGGIVPHAGWYFSGHLASRAIAALSGGPSRQKPDVIVVFGMHLHPGSSPRIMTDGTWETPFGNIDIATDLAGRLARKFSFAVESADHFTPDNTIELQLPFIKYFFNTSRLIPIGAPPAAVSLDIARTLMETAREENISMKVVGSTDLTHYGVNYGFSPSGSGSRAVSWARDQNDRNVIDRMLAMDPKGVIEEALSRQNACCGGAAAAAITAAASLGATQAQLAGYSSSFDKHPSDSFVGYAGLLFRK